MGNVLSGIGDAFHQAENDVQQLENWFVQKVAEIGLAGCEYILQGLGINQEESLNAIHAVMQQFGIEAGIVIQVLQNIWNDGLENYVRNKIQQQFAPYVVPPQQFVDFHSAFLAFHESQARDLNSSFMLVTSGSIVSPTVTQITREHGMYLASFNTLFSATHNGVGAGNTYLFEAQPTVEEIIEAALVGALVGVIVAIVLAPETAGVGSAIALSATAVFEAAAIGALVGLLLEYSTHLMRHLNEATQLLIQAIAQLAQLIAADVQKLEMAIIAAIDGMIHLAATISDQEIQDLAQVTGIAVEIIREWVAMGLTVDQIIAASILLVEFGAQGLSAYDAGQFALRLTGAQLALLTLALGTYLAVLCGGITGLSDILINIIQSGINPLDMNAAQRINPLFKKVMDLASLAKSGDIGAQRVLGVINKIGLQNVLDIDDPTQSGGRGADIVLKGDPPVGIEVGGASKVGNDSQYQTYIDEYGKENVRVYLQNDDGNASQAVAEAEKKLGKDHVEQFTKDDLKCV
jgi:hypothetical protein